LTVLNNYTDLEPLEDDDVCYQILAYYDVQQGSTKVENCLNSGVIKNNNVSRATLYPNPFKNEINISSLEAVKSVQIMNITGQKVKEVTFDCKTISTGELSNGIYFVIIESITGNRTVHKMIKN
jgi:hypothetical protein